MIGLALGSIGFIRDFQLLSKVIRIFNKCIEPIKKIQPYLTEKTSDDHIQFFPQSLFLFSGKFNIICNCFKFVFILIYTILISYHLVNVPLLFIEPRGKRVFF